MNETMALGFVLCFIAGSGFGVWLSLTTMRRARRQWREDRAAAEKENWNFQPIRNDNFDPTKQPVLPEGFETAGEKSESFERPRHEQP